MGKTAITKTGDLKEVVRLLADIDSKLAFLIEKVQ